MTTYQLVMLTRGPNHAAASTPDGGETLKAHVQFLYKLAADGVAKAAGPFTDDGEIQGVIIMAAASPQKAKEVEAGDPAVKAGIFAMEVLPFMAPEGWFGAWAEYGRFERVYFGFLNRGPNRSQDAETAKKLQAEHLAYMDGQAELGKLVVAGPFAVDTARRGIVVYRVASLEEARERAEGDPMIKAGRLVVELHPWQIPEGAIPSKR
jgi:uncharacterized protein YciI